mmetsp:Transcript_22907/g.54423  ORF Transcript_22907/g.54423 Transcript_22907/m.54423 type:complete len:264 (+) Transcript_22907:1793-2584(+)
MSRFSLAVSSTPSKSRLSSSMPSTSSASFLFSRLIRYCCLDTILVSSIIACFSSAVRSRRFPSSSSTCCESFSPASFLVFFSSRCLRRAANSSRSCKSRIRCSSSISHGSNASSSLSSSTCVFAFLVAGSSLSDSESDHLLFLRSWRFVCFFSSFSLFFSSFFSNFSSLFFFFSSSTFSSSSSSSSYSWFFFSISTCFICRSFSCLFCNAAFSAARVSPSGLGTFFMSCTANFLLSSLISIPLSLSNDSSEASSLDLFPSAIT